jgi:Na+(H+)/acetate symporter ActP
MQFLILVTGAMVFVFFLYQKPPLLFHPLELQRIESQPGYAALAERYDGAFEDRRRAVTSLAEARRTGDSSQRARGLADYRAAQQRFDDARAQGIRMVGGEFSDTNYIFLSFVTRYMPAGIVGLMIAVVFIAATSSTSAEVNSLATVTVIDLYRRHVRKNGTDRHYLWASRIASAFWGIYAVAFAEYARTRVGSLIEAVNMVGSLFYGGMLGVFVLAFAFPRVRGTAAFVGVLAGEAAIFYAHWATSISFLWYNALGCLVVIAVGLLLSTTKRGQTHLI